MYRTFLSDLSELPNEGIQSVANELLIERELAEGSASGPSRRYSRKPYKPEAPAARKDIIFEKLKLAYEFERERRDLNTFLRWLPCGEGVDVVLRSDIEGYELCHMKEWNRLKTICYAREFWDEANSHRRWTRPDGSVIAGNDPGLYPNAFCSDGKYVWVLNSWGPEPLVWCLIREMNRSRRRGGSVWWV